MGSLILPESGLVYVDSQILIYSVERYPNYLNVVSPIWQASRNGSIEVVTSELSVLEVMTGAIKMGDQGMIDMYDELMQGTEIRLIPVDLQILLNAARLRAETSLRTPDAIHAATASRTNCSTLITNDLAFRVLQPTLNVQILKDVITT